MFDTAYIHIGTEKTGSTSIQALLTHNRLGLLERGYLYSESFELPNHVGLAGYAGDVAFLRGLGARLGLSSHEAQAAYRVDIERRFAAEARANDGATLLLSNEHLHSRIVDGKAVERLHGLLQPHCQKIKIVVYLRRQDRLATSLASTYHKTGHTAAWELPNLKKRLIWSYYDYAGLLDRYASVFGAENCMVRLFERSRLKSGDVAEDFLEVVGVPDWSERQKPPRANESLNNLGIEALAELYKHLKRSGVEDPLWGELMGVIAREYVGRPQLVSRHQAVDFYENFRASNALVKQRHFTDLERPTLFDEEFTDYPEALSPDARTFEEGIEIAAKLWLNRVRVISKLRGKA